MAGKLPYLQFFPGDWLRDNIAGCSLAAQGLWLRMMIIGHDSDRYGYLSMNGSPMQAESIARRVGCSLPEFESLLAELDAAGVPSRTPEGFIFSRRMVRDAQGREVNAKRQKRHYDRRNKPNGESNADPNAHLTPNEDESESEDDSEGCLSDSEKSEILYQAYPRHIGYRAALKAIQRALEKESFDSLRGAVEAYAVARKGQEKQYTPYPSTWFNEERWKDDRSDWKSNGHKSGPGQHYDPGSKQPTIGGF